MSARRRGECQLPQLHHRPVHSEQRRPPRTVMLGLEQGQGTAALLHRLARPELPLAGPSTAALAATTMELVQ